MYVLREKKKQRDYTFIPTLTYIYIYIYATGYSGEIYFRNDAIVCK